MLATPALVFAFVCGASLLVGARFISVGDIVAAVVDYNGSVEHSTMLSLRIPRLFAGVCAGMALGLAGALLQALTRNPLADTGVFGVNAGAAFAMVLAIGTVGATSHISLMLFAFAGAGLATLAVYAAASTGPSNATPLRLVLAGVAIGSILRGLTAAYVLTDPDIFDRLLNWDVGSLAIIGGDRVWIALPFAAVGIAIAFLVAPALNVTALGDQTAQALGTGLVQVRVVVVAAVMVLAGTATAIAGPIGFLGLMAPQLSRAICGTDQRRIFACTLLLAPAILLTADIVGRLVMMPAEVPVGLVTAFVGAPILIWLVRQGRVAAL